MKIAFTTNKYDPISEVVRYFTEDKGSIRPTASHCFPIIGEICGIELGLSADEVLINLIEVDRYRNKPGVALRIYEFPDVVDPKIWIKEMLGKYNEKIYPHAELIWFVWDWLKDMVFPHSKDDKNWIDYSGFCSEISLLSMRSAGYSGWFKGYDPNSISPTELEDLVAKIPYCNLIENQDYDSNIIYG